jgi:hypothetical protein
VVRFGPKNAGRRCTFDCLTDTMRYILSQGMFSGVACDDHLKDAIQKARS